MKGALALSAGRRQRAARVLPSHVLDAGGRPVPMALVYEASASGRRFRGFESGPTGPNTADWEIDRIRARVRKLVANDPRFRRGLNTLVANLIGTGIKPQSALESRDQRQVLHALWDDWVDEADADGVSDFYGFEDRVARAVIQDGEVFVRIRARRPEDGLTVPLQLQLLEADHCPIYYTILDTVSGNTIRSGIEFDLIGRRVAYWMTKAHPSDPTIIGTPGSLIPLRIDAREILHIYRVERPGQIRGVPWFASGVLRAHDLDVYDDAQVQRQKAAACFAGIIETPDLDGSVADLDDDGTAAAPTLEVGTLWRAEPGEKITWPDLPSMGADYDSFKQWAARDLFAGMGLTYEQGTGDLSSATYSSARVGTLEFRRYAEPLIHNVFAYQLCRPVWQRWFDAAVAAGALAVPGYAQHRREFQRVRWIPQGWPWVDPQKDVQAKLEAIATGLTSPQEAISEQGNDPERVLDDHATWKEMLAARGLTSMDLAAHGQQRLNHRETAVGAPASGDAPDGSGAPAPDSTP